MYFIDVTFDWREPYAIFIKESAFFFLIIVIFVFHVLINCIIFARLTEKIA